MPTGGLIGNFQAQSTRAISVWAGQRDITSDLLLETLGIDDASEAQGRLSGTINETLANLPELTDQSLVRVFDEVRATEMFRGFTKRRKPTLVPRWTSTELVATDHGELLDRYIPGLYTRPAGESDAARIGFFWGWFGSPFLSPDLASVAVVNASLPRQIFQGVTLRRALDMIAAQASASARWYLDQTGHLHYFASETNAAPKNITSDTPGAGEIAPEDLDIDYDAMGYANAVYVVGQNSTGSGWVYDHDEIARVGTIVSAEPLEAPDCATAAMRNALGAMYLGRVASSTPRGSFSVTSAKADGWRSGQTLDVRSAAIGIDEAFRISRVATRQIKPGTFRYSIEFGGSRRGTSTGGGGSGATPSGLGVQELLNELRFMDESGDEPGAVTGLGGDIYFGGARDAYVTAERFVWLYPNTVGSLLEPEGAILANGPLAYVSGTLNVVVAGSTLSHAFPLERISAASPVTITAAPTITDGWDGQVLVVVNVGANAITIQDQGTLASSNLRLSTATYAMGTRDSITLIYSDDVGDWIETARTNVI